MNDTDIEAIFSAGSNNRLILIGPKTHNMIRDHVLSLGGTMCTWEEAMAEHEDWEGDYAEDD